MSKFSSKSKASMDFSDLAFTNQDFLLEIQRLFANGGTCTSCAVEKFRSVARIQRCWLASLQCKQLKDFWNLTPSVRLPLTLEITRSNNTAG